MRRASAGWGAALCAVAASCGTIGRGPLAPPLLGSTPSAGWVARAHAATPLLALVEHRPELGDLVLYLRARDAARGGDVAGAFAHVAELETRYPDSIWLPGARFLAGQLRRRSSDLDGARETLALARDGFTAGGDRWLACTLALGEVEHLRGDEQSALTLARAVRQAKPGGLVARRAIRLAARIRRTSPTLFALPESELAEAELDLGEGNTAAAAAAAQAVLAGSPDPETRAQALWVRARVERAQGARSDAEATCQEIARTSDTLGPKALGAAARWRWNLDDDAAALRLYRQLVARFADSSEAGEALYAIGRIHQEAGRYDDAFDAYDRLAREMPHAQSAPEARWRAGWVRYLAGDLAGAAAYFAGVQADGPPSVRPAAAYWEARIRGVLADPEADVLMAAVADRYPASYYGALAAERLGRGAPDASDPVMAPAPTPFPATLDGPHAERARALASLGLVRLARRELDAVGDDAPRAALAEAFTAVDAPGAAILAVRRQFADGDEDLKRYVYPLGFWPTIEREARAHGLDPLLVSALIRQESLFLPDASSAADAHGLMQLLPRTARDLAPAAGLDVVDAKMLDGVAVNVRLGTTLLRRLLDRYHGSRVKALAAYNAGEDAVGKWEARYGARADDEFVELISYRETRDYVRLVLQNLQIYRQLYAPSALATSAGSPPNAPFDMMTTTSPGRAEPTT